MITAVLLAASLALAPQQSTVAEPAAAPTDAAGLTALLLERKDDADPELVRRLSNLRSAEALDGLTRFYDSLNSLYMRRIALHGFALFDGVPEAEEAALQQLVDVATTSIDTELRETAIDDLGGCNGGHRFLGAIVASGADDAVREHALRQHVAGARPEDVDWYLSIWRPQPKEKEKEKKGRRKDDAAPSEVQYTEPLRELAFEGLAASRTSDELIEATESRLVLVRRRALEELAARRDAGTEKCAERMLDDRRERPDVRLLAAEILLGERGAKYADELYDVATRGEVPLELAFGIADLLSALDDAGVRSRAVKQLTQGQEQEKRFHVRLCARVPDPKVDKALLALTEDDSRAVAVDALRALGERGNPTFVPRLEEALKKERDPAVLAAVIESLHRIQGSDPAWRGELAALASSPTESVRNAALEALGATRDASHVPTLVAALEHPSWTTRLAAARALETVRAPEGVGALAKRMGSEEGRMAVELSDILWRLTAQPFRTDAKQWARWWEAEGASFRFPTDEEFQKRRAERDLRADKQLSQSFRGVKVDSRFFGLRIASHHVAFVLDVSGSMEERLPGKETAEHSPTRMEVARKELLACLEALEAGTYFNILPFSQGVSPWKETAVEATEESFAEAREFVQELGAFGGTNVHAGLKQAFADPDVDTIFFLSDGKPSGGEIEDPAAIRDEVRAWNDQRGVVIHTISIGERFPLLEWLAEDSGGVYRTYP